VIKVCVFFSDREFLAYSVDIQREPSTAAKSVYQTI